MSLDKISESLDEIKSLSKVSIIEAIKKLRSVSGAGLKEAKFAIDVYEARGDDTEMWKLLGRTPPVRPGCTIGFEGGTAVFMPSTLEVKVEGVFSMAEWNTLNRILSAAAGYDEV